MKDYAIITDGNSGICYDFAEKHNILVVPMPYIVGGVDFDGSPENSMTPKEFYGKLKEGVETSTYQKSPDEYKQIFRKCLAEGKDVIYFCFSSGLSSTINSAIMAANELSEEYSENQILVVDTKSASAGESFLVEVAALQKEEKNLGIKELAAFVQELSLKVRHYFCVDDLNFLYKGGRLSKTQAVLGGILNVKPILVINDEGKIVPLTKVRGRKEVVEALSDYVVNHIDLNVSDRVAIMNADEEEYAEKVKSRILQKNPSLKVEIRSVSFAVGSHSGPGTMAVVFFGKDRNFHV